MESVFDFNMFSNLGRYLEAARKKDRFRGRIFIYYILIGTFYLGPKNVVTLVFVFKIFSFLLHYNSFI